MIKYAKMKNTICTYDAMRKEMVQGLPKAVVDHILEMAKPFQVDGTLYVDRKNVDKCAREVLGMKPTGRPAKGEDQDDVCEAILREKEQENAELRRQIEELEYRLQESGGADEQLRAKIKELQDILSDREKELDALSKAYNDVFRERGEFLTALDQEKNARASSEKKAAELERKMEQADKDHAQTVKNLTGRIAELNRQCNEAKKNGTDQDDNSPKSRLKQTIREKDKALADKVIELNNTKAELEKARQENEQLRSSSSAKKVIELGMKVATLEKSFEEKSEECELLEDENKGLNEKLSKTKESLRASEQQVKRLQEALEKSKTAAAERDEGGVFSSINEYYPGEAWDFIGYLAKQRLAMLPDEDASSYRRERDLCESLVALIPDSGSQQALTGEIENAVRMKFDKGSNAGLMSLGFTLESTNNHEKFVLSNTSGALANRVSLIFAKTPSDRRARREATSNLLKMLTFCSTQKESATAEEEKKAN